MAVLYRACGYALACHSSWMSESQRVAIVSPLMSCGRSAQGFGRLPGSGGWAGRCTLLQGASAVLLARVGGQRGSTRRAQRPRAALVPEQSQLSPHTPDQKVPTGSRNAILAFELPCGPPSSRIYQDLPVLFSTVQ